MTKNPILNALGALTYIALLASCAVYGEPLFKLLPLSNVPVVFVPITVLSVFVFSAALMVYFFVYQPLLLLLAGEKQKALVFFLQTIGSFALSVVTLVAIGITASVFVSGSI